MHIYTVTYTHMYIEASVAYGPHVWPTQGRKPNFGSSMGYKCNFGVRLTHTIFGTWGNWDILSKALLIAFVKLGA